MAALHSDSGYPPGKPSLTFPAPDKFASQGLSKDAMTLARLYRRFVSTGALPRESTVVIDEISLLSHRDFETCVLPLARLGVQLILLGDPASQLLAISDIGANGEELAQDISESVMLKSAVGLKDCGSLSAVGQTRRSLNGTSRSGRAARATSCRSLIS